MKKEQKRALSLDAFRGYSILTMVLSSGIVFGVLPAWMYHAQGLVPTFFLMSLSMALHG